MERVTVDYREITEFLDNLKFRRKLFGASQTKVYSSMRELDGLYRKKIEELQRLYEQELSELEAEVASAHHDREKAVDECARKTDEISRLQDNYSERLSKIKYQHQMIQSLTDSLKRQTVAEDSCSATEQEERTRLLSELRAQNEALTQELRRAHARLGKSEQFLVTLTEKLKAKEEEVNEYASRLENAEALLERRGERIEELTLELWELKRRFNSRKNSLYVADSADEPTEDELMAAWDAKNITGGREAQKKDDHTAESNVFYGHAAKEKQPGPVNKENHQIAAEPFYGHGDDSSEPFYGHEDDSAEPFYGHGDDSSEPFYGHEDDSAEPFYGHEDDSAELFYGHGDDSAEPFYGHEDDSADDDFLPEDETGISLTNDEEEAPNHIVHLTERELARLRAESAERNHHHAPKKVVHEPQNTAAVQQPHKAVMPPVPHPQEEPKQEPISVQKVPVDVMTEVQQAKKDDLGPQMREMMRRWETGDDLFSDISSPEQPEQAAPAQSTQPATTTDGDKLSDAEIDRLFHAGTLKKSEDAAVSLVSEDDADASLAFGEDAPVWEEIPEEEDAPAKAQPAKPSAPPAPVRIAVHRPKPKS